MRLGKLVLLRNSPREAPLLLSSSPPSFFLLPPLPPHTFQRLSLSLFSEPSLSLNHNVQKRCAAIQPRRRGCLFHWPDRFGEFLKSLSRLCAIPSYPHGRCSTSHHVPSLPPPPPPSPSPSLLYTPLSETACIFIAIISMDALCFFSRPSLPSRLSCR